MKKKRIVKSELMAALDSPTPLGSELVNGLAQAWGIEGFRKYVVYQIKLAIEQAATCPKEEFDVKRGSLEALQRIARALKGAYTDFIKAEELRKKPNAVTKG